MSVIHVTGTWSFTRSQFIHFVLRLAVGFLLILKGFYFISNMHQLHTMVAETGPSMGTSFFAHYIPWAHMLGGAFIMLGLFTRIAIILQIPIIGGALMYNLMGTTFGTGGELVLSIVLLVLMIYFLIKGSGKISMDDYLKRKQL